MTLADFLNFFHFLIPPCLLFRRWTWRTCQATSRASWACLTEGSSTVASWKLSSAGSQLCDFSSSLVAYHSFLCLPRPALPRPHPFPAAWQHIPSACAGQPQNPIFSPDPPPKVTTEWMISALSAHNSPPSLNPYFLQPGYQPVEFHLLNSPTCPVPFLTSSPSLSPMLCLTSPDQKPEPLIPQRWPFDPMITPEPWPWLHWPLQSLALSTLH